MPSFPCYNFEMELRDIYVYYEFHVLGLVIVYNLLHVYVIHVFSFTCCFVWI
jgi:hypothetical protein